MKIIFFLSIALFSNLIVTMDQPKDKEEIVKTINDLPGYFGNLVSKFHVQEATSLNQLDFDILYDLYHLRLDVCLGCAEMVKVQFDSMINRCYLSKPFEGYLKKFLIKDFKKTIGIMTNNWFVCDYKKLTYYEVILPKKVREHEKDWCFFYNKSYSDLAHNRIGNYGDTLKYSSLMRRLWALLIQKFDLSDSVEFNNKILIKLEDGFINNVFKFTMYDEGYLWVKKSALREFERIFNLKVLEKK